MENIYGEHSANRFRIGKDRFFHTPGQRIIMKGIWGETAGWVLQKQLMRRDLWRRLVEQFRQSDADYDQGWRGEYWGKMMRGACFVYESTHDAALYAMLEETIRDILTTQDSQGRISTYHCSHELEGWDLWCRKYVLLGMQYFYEICQDNALKQRLIASMMSQADAILARIGQEEGKKSITTATCNWRGLNSSSLLEPIIRLYNITGEERYLNFGSYIAAQGGTDVADIFLLARQDELSPYQYPVTKAYEMISCFEGLLELYRVTGQEEYRLSVERFANRVLKTDFTVIGGSGCTHELFDHSTVRQANTTNGSILQETCVTVTLMKFFSQLTLLTGQAKYMDAFERSAYNAYLGTVNTENALSSGIQAQQSLWIHEPLPFDSYSPLTAGVRGKGIGGLKVMLDRHYYGCCACIGSLGVGLMGHMACLTTEDGLAISLYSPCEIITTTPSGQEVRFSMDTNYPREGFIRLRLKLQHPEAFTLRIRIPQWSRDTSLKINEKAKRAARGYMALRRRWKDGDVLTLYLDMRTEVLHPISYHHDVLMNKVIWNHDMIIPQYDREDGKARHHYALRRGPIILAQDARLGYDVETPHHAVVQKDGYINATVSCARIAFPHIIAAEIPCADGSTMPVVDYASAGKTWTEKSKMAAWIYGDCMMEKRYSDLDAREECR